MQQLEADEFLTLKQAASLPLFRSPRTGRPINVAQLYRWVQRGARAIDGSRVRLQAVKLPGGLRVSRAAIRLFIEQLNRPVAPPSFGRRDPESEAERELLAAGFEITSTEGVGDERV